MGCICSEGTVKARPRLSDVFPLRRMVSAVFANTVLILALEHEAYLLCHNNVRNESQWSDCT
jgi:hypothetical protein